MGPPFSNSENSHGYPAVFRRFLAIDLGLFCGFRSELNETGSAQNIERTDDDFVLLLARSVQFTRLASSEKGPCESVLLTLGERLSRKKSSFFCKILNFARRHCVTAPLEICWRNPRPRGVGKNFPMCVYHRGERLFKRNSAEAAAPLFPSASSAIWGSPNFKFLPATRRRSRASPRGIAMRPRTARATAPLHPA